MGACVGYSASAALAKERRSQEENVQDQYLGKQRHMIYTLWYYVACYTPLIMYLRRRDTNFVLPRLFKRKAFFLPLKRRDLRPHGRTMWHKEPWVPV